MNAKTKDLLSTIFGLMMLFTFCIPVIPVAGFYAYDYLFVNEDQTEQQVQQPIASNKQPVLVCEITNSKVLASINTYRTSKGLGTLTELSGLNAVSEKYSITSIGSNLSESQLNSYTDDSINYLKSFYANPSITVNTIYGSNYRTSDDLISGWAAKPDLRAVLENGEVSRIGLAAGCNSGSIYGGASVVFAQIKTQPTPSYSNSGYRTGAICNDGTSSSATGSGACSWHGGVDYWLYD
jgi:hypothetical protein